MPVINVQIGKVQTEKKKELIKTLTTTASEITGIPESSFVVFIDEHEYENIGVGGESLADRRAK